MKHMVQNSVLFDSKNFPILEILDKSGLCFSVKNKNLEYVYLNSTFCKKFSITDGILSDFGIFIPDIAYELNKQDSFIFVNKIPKEQDSVLITKGGEEYIYNLSRSIVSQNDQEYLVTLYRDITKQSQQQQFNAYKQVLSEPEQEEKIVNRFYSVIFGADSEKTLFTCIGRLALDLLKLGRISYYTASTDLSPKKVYSTDSEEYAQTSIVENTDNYSLPPKGLIDRCQDTLQTITENNHRSEDTLYNSAMAIPIIYNGKLLGIIKAESAEKNTFNLRITNILVNIAHQIAIKINALNIHQKLKHRTNYLTSFVENLPASVAILDLEGNYLLVSKQWYYDFLPNKNVDLIGSNHFVLNPNLPTRWQKRIKEAYNGVTQDIPREIYKRKNGNIEFYSGKVNPWYTKEKEVGGVVIKAIKQKEQEHKIEIIDADKELTEAKNIGHIFTWKFNITNREFTVVSQPTTLLESKNFTSLDLVFEHIQADYHDDIKRQLKQAIDNKSSFEIVHPFSVGKTKYWLHNRGKTIYENGELVHVIGNAQDITNQIEAERAYKSKTLELIKINSELDQFVYKTAHDLRAPLTNVLGLINLMRSEENIDILSSYFDLQEKSIEKLDGFIKEIVTYGKNTRLPVQMTEVNFSKIIDSVLQELNFVKNSEQIVKTVRIDTTKQYYTDPDRVLVILRNLVTNAVKFCDVNKSSQKIEIDISEQNNTIQIQVMDNGVGINEDIQPRIFDMFYRGHKTSEGSGIGLYIVRETLKKLKGKIKLESTPGEYTLFTIHLPSQTPTIN